MLDATIERTRDSVVGCVFVWQRHAVSPGKLTSAFAAAELASDEWFAAFGAMNKGGTSAVLTGRVRKANPCVHLSTDRTAMPMLRLHRDGGSEGTENPLIIAGQLLCINCRTLV